MPLLGHEFFLKSWRFLLPPPLQWIADALPVKPRSVPETWTMEDRSNYREIAQRRQDEMCALYTLVAIGLQRSSVISDLEEMSKNV